MPNITDDELDEYNNLKSLYFTEKFQIIQDSINSITKLEDDIDAPIKRCVAMFALLGCEPRFSCCGFNYFGQPIHKSHQLGNLYFLLGNKVKALHLMVYFPAMAFVYKTRPDAVDISYSIPGGSVIKEWDSPDCIHQTEQVTGLIRYLEDYLLLYKDEFLDEVVLKDTNGEYRKNLSYWQYPPKEDWLITKEWVLDSESEVK